MAFCLLTLFASGTSPETLTGNAPGCTGAGRAVAAANGVAGDAAAGAGAVLAGTT